MRGPYAHEFLLLFGLLLLCGTRTAIHGFAFNLRNSDDQVTCVEEERQALLKFKHGLEDYSSRLSSWGTDEEDCCKWKGIECSNRTGHVVKLDLRGIRYPYVNNQYVSGEISSSLLGLQHLTYLDLSHNYFNLPKFIGSITKLQYLNLSYNFLSGTIPPQLGNLSSLISLDLSSNNMLIEEHNLDWLVHLSSLRHLDMGDVNLSMVVNWPDKVNMLPSLLDLGLSFCGLSMSVPHVLSNSISSSPLSFLNLYGNHLNSSIFPWLFKYTNTLVHLDLSFNELEGSIPKAFGNMVALVHLDLSYNKLEGSIPKAFGNMVALVHLDLSYNKLEGSIPKAFGNMVALVHLDLTSNNLEGAIPDLTKLSLLRELRLSNNQLKGVVTEAHLSNLSSLNQLDLSFNSNLSMKFSPDWVPPFHLDTIRLSSCKLGPAFPQWLQTQKNFSQLEMSGVGITDTIPNWFWELSSNIELLNISRNQINSTIHSQWFLGRFIGAHVIDLSYNRFSGPLPQITSNGIVLNLSNNLFQGTIKFTCETNGSSIRYLDLSNNMLSGELPKCWENMMQLRILNLANNNLSGRIPESFGINCCKQDSFMTSLHFQKNSFIGELPMSLMNCSCLSVLDFGENKLSGKIPTWIGTSLLYLVVLRLPSNMFVGSIPLQLCHLTFLQILDLSHNNISGTIPRCLSNFTAMAQKHNFQTTAFDYSLHINLDANSSIQFITGYIEHASVNTKGKLLEYYKILKLVKVIDLSSNKLKGEIPGEITSLLELIGLNLSRNLLTGIIPKNIGDMKGLESLDLSSNHLSDVIPSSLATLSFLSYLNLSNNNLSGIVPTGIQLQSFNASSYVGNRYLCGLPLLKRCPGDEATRGEGNIQEHANSLEHLWFYTSIAIGFIGGFWGVCGSLMLKSSWRHAYFQFLDKMGDILYATIAINMVKLLRNLKTQCYQENI